MDLRHNDCRMSSGCSGQDAGDLVMVANSAIAGVGGVFLATRSVAVVLIAAVMSVLLTLLGARRHG